MSRIAIAKPSAGAVRASAISRLAKPGFGLRSATGASTKSATNENTGRAATQVSHMQRKTFLRCLNGGNKYGSSEGQTTMKPPPLSALSANDRTMSAEPTTERPLNVTETISSKSVDIQSETVVVASNIDRCLTRSGTFVCEASDETQAKLLSLTHNINSPTPTPPPTVNEVNQIMQKERTFKRSLSPIYGEQMSMAKRKSTQMLNQTGVVNSIGPMVISTPRANTEQTIPSFTTRSTLSNITELESTMTFMDQSHLMSSTAVRSARLIDVTLPSHAVVINEPNSGINSKNLTKLLYVADGSSFDGGNCDSNETLIGAGDVGVNADEKNALSEITRTHCGKSCKHHCINSFLLVKCAAAFHFTSAFNRLFYFPFFIRSNFKV